MRFDGTGKVTLDHIYTAPDPREYFRTLRALDYRIPQLAKPYFHKIIDEYRQARGVRVPTVLDIGSSYGVNAALLKCDATLDELYEHYAGVDELDRDALVARDRGWIRSRDRVHDVRFTGLDTSRPALDYGLSAGFLDDAVHSDLEQHDPTPPQRDQLADADLVVSTGCLGYVGERTLRRVAEASGQRKPWMAHFVLRMFPFDGVAASLAALGYETVHVDGVFEQRRFASPRERSQMLDTLSSTGVDPAGLEAEGWLYAELFLSRPRA